MPLIYNPDQVFPNLGFYNNGSTGYQFGFNPNPLGDKLYQHAGDLASQVYADSLSIWEREDSAYQRMVEDMKKAGLNPWTGLSSGGSPTSSTNPSMDSLTSLLQVLDGSLKTESTYTQSSKRLFDMVINALTAFVPLVK